ncbi:MAG: hypothetical protein EBQ87_14960 [Planctomycetes bacterium]|nr:hypothetical protein [Planctomycetota bacterium]
MIEGSDEFAGGIPLRLMQQSTIHTKEFILEILKQSVLYRKRRYTFCCGVEVDLVFKGREVLNPAGFI